MSATYPVGAKVWVKMQDYPWWPGVVVDADAIQADTSLRAPEQDLCVQCLPSHAPSVMFVSSRSDDEVRLYAGPVADEQLIAEGQAHPECAPAVAEALATFEDAAADAEALGELADAEVELPMRPEDSEDAADKKRTGAGRHRSRSSSSSSDDGDDEEKLLLNIASAAPEEAEEEAAGDSAAAKEERRRLRKQRKREERNARKAAEKGREKDSRSRKRDRAAGNHNDDNNGNRKKPKKRSGSVDPRDLRQTQLDAYKTEAARAPATSHLTGDDAEYYSRELQSRRQSVSDAMMRQYAERLREVTGECLENDSYEEQEDALLELLRPLAAYDVSYDQLRTTGIGAIVGALLKPTFPARVRALANGILAYWFRTLPNQIQTELTVDNEMDRCSIETTAGTRSDGMEGTLGAVGLHLYESFTEEELYDAPANTNVVEVCKNIETLLRDNSDDLDTRVVVLSTIGDPRNTALRRGILDGKFTPNDILTHANDLNSLLREVNKRGLPHIRTDFGLDGSPTSPYTPFSPTGFGNSGRGSTGSPGFSPTGGGMGTFTTLYTCPQCGASEAYRTEYTVQAHDNFPEILRCRKCGTTWNAAE